MSEPTCCTRCGERLNPARLVWLSLDQRTNTYTDGEIPPESDQGGFPFGRACAKAAKAEHAAACPVVVVLKSDYHLIRWNRATRDVTESHPVLRDGAMHASPDEVIGAASSQRRAAQIATAYAREHA